MTARQLGVSELLARPNATVAVRALASFRRGDLRAHAGDLLRVPRVLLPQLVREALVELDRSSTHGHPNEDA